MNTHFELQIQNFKYKSNFPLSSQFNYEYWINLIVLICSALKKKQWTSPSFISGGFTIFGKSKLDFHEDFLTNINNMLNINDVLKLQLQ